jgi:hypothetical protein
MNDKQDNIKKTKSSQPGEKLKDRIHRHLSDKNDIITEEDIRDTLTSNQPEEENKNHSKKK